ncbi:MAG: acyl-CoA dehydrogenase family protein [Elusimicrobia bacterium]|nr:acyl-CoA dehydrogenase family protein [Elusimicrobiota bacterium]
MSADTKIDTAAGGYFSIPDGLGFPVNKTIFTPEKFSDEQKMAAETAGKFIEKEVAPKIAEIDGQKGDYGLTVGLLKKVAELGFLGTDVPEEYGGAGCDFITAMLVSEILGMGGSWAVSWAAHSGIGTHPLLFFGTKEQKKKYLVKLVSGEWVGAFAATEPEAGTDLYGAKTKATLSGDGKFYILNGSKTFISNSGFANLFTVLAKVDGDPKKSACFLVERGSPGFTIGKEENKMGICGSSTCPLNLENVKVPVENLLGEPGKGIHIIFNTLNLGRLKLGAMTVGPSKHVITEAVQYALERKQFAMPIAQFGLIKEKLAGMVVGAWMTESAVYRTAALIEEKLKATDLDNPAETLEALREYEIECSILKVAGSEMFWHIADENVQLHGGYGYIKDYAAERYQRDSRINRIFEGTNEINRLTVVLNLLDRAGKGRLPLAKAGAALAGQLEETSGEELPDEPLALQAELVNSVKKMFFVAGGRVLEKFPAKEKILVEQEILGRLSNMLSLIYIAESGLLRAKETGGEIPEAIVGLYVQNAALEAEKLAKEVLAFLEEGDMLKSYLGRIKRLGRTLANNLADPVTLQRKIADNLIEKKKYFL